MSFNSLSLTVYLALYHYLNNALTDGQVCVCVCLRVRVVFVGFRVTLNPGGSFLSST